LNEPRSSYRDFDESPLRARGAGTGAGLGITLLLVGLGIGVVTALLLAPEAGHRTRRRLRRRYENARDVIGDWTDQASDAWDRGSDWADDTRERMGKRVRPIRKSIFG
jgi:gas vesicle protein